jgi:RNA polymerase sigma-70 factor (ECF subfamily)
MGHVRVEETSCDGDAWLARFHAGERQALEACYRDHFATVDGAVGRLLSGADRETVVHELFFRLMSSEPLRRAYRGGSFVAWLSTVARNHAIDHVRRQRREQPAGAMPQGWSERPDEAALEQQAEARLLIDRFRDECLPPAWKAVFQARFLDQLDQREAARRLGIRRTTLAYQEYRIRVILRRYLLRAEAGPSAPGRTTTPARTRKGRA